jgi:hypothetical protein
MFINAQHPWKWTLLPFTQLQFKELVKPALNRSGADADAFSQGAQTESIYMLLIHFSSELFGPTLVRKYSGEALIEVATAALAVVFPCHQMQYGAARPEAFRSNLAGKPRFDPQLTAFTMWALYRAGIMALDNLWVSAAYRINLIQLRWKGIL